MAESLAARLKKYLVRALQRLPKPVTSVSISIHDFMFLLSQYGDLNELIRGYSDNSDDQVRAWVTQACELTFDMEDWMRLYYLRMFHGETSFLDMLGKLPDLEARSKALIEERPSFIMPQRIHDPRPTTLLHVKTECLVGLDEAIDEVTRKITDAGDKPGRKIVSITGMAGSGKTTLAATVYQRLREQNGFHYRAFIFVGQKPVLRRILNELLSQLGDEHNASEEIFQKLVSSIGKLLKDKRYGGLKELLSQLGDEHNEREDIDKKLVSSIGDLLKDKRYLIVLDDLWSLQDWATIQDCFPHNNLGSRIINTTRNDDVASGCSSWPSDYVRKMGLLSDTDSKQLFLKQLLTTGHACPPYWDEFSDQIMTRCGGLPLAVVSVAAMVAHNPSRDEWERLGSNLLSSSHMDGLKQTLNLSYEDLPLNLRPYLLYLSIFPYSYRVEVKRLMRLYAAEVHVITTALFISEKHAKDYLNDLTSRYMVQLLHTKSDHGSGFSLYLRLHPVIHDFIVCKSKEENFVALVDAQHQHEPIHHETIRRLSIQSSDKQDEALPWNVTMNLTHVRSVTVFGQATAAPRLTALSLCLRVLDLEGCNGPVCLDGLHNLRLLMYLSLRGTELSELPESISTLKFLKVLDVGFTKVTELPSSIGAIWYLECLSLRGTDVRELPASIGKLQLLRTLDVRSTKVTQLPGSIDSIETRTRIPVAIQNCYNLQKLVTVDLSNQPPNFVESLHHLHLLGVISLTWSFHQCSDEAYRKALLSSISNWNRLTSLTIHCGLGCSMEFLGSLSSPPRWLVKFKVTAGRFACVPKWFSELNHLSFVQITVCKQGTEQLKILGDLPSLRRLILGLDFITETPMVIESGCFQELERFSVDCPRPWLSFSEGSMEKLTYLELKLCACPVSSVPSGIDKLQRIEEVSICYRSLEQRSPNISTIVRAMRKAVTEHPNRIALFINGTPQDYNAEAAEAEASSASGTGIGNDAGITDDNQRTDEVLVNETTGIQSTSEIEEIES